MSKTIGLDGLAEWLCDETKNIVNAMANNIHDDAKANTPVGETGRLKASWTVKEALSVNNIAEVENNAPYAEYVENGTNKAKGHLMLTNAIEKELGGSK